MKLSLFIFTIGLCIVVNPCFSGAASASKKAPLSSLTSEVAFITRFKPGTTYREVKSGLPSGVTMSRTIFDQQANIVGFIATLQGQVVGQISFLSRSSYHALNDSGKGPKLSISEPIYEVRVRMRDGAVKSKQASKSRISALITLLGKPKTSRYDEWNEGEGGWDVEWTLPDKAVVTYDENPLDGTRRGELSISYFEAYGYRVASPVPQSVARSATESSDIASHKQLNAFFSKVAQADLGSFRGRPSDNEMIGFALVHILMEQPELLGRETGVSGFARIQPRVVEQMAEAFFGQHIRKNQTISSDFKFVNGSYLVSTREWEEMLFAQVTKLNRSDHGRLTANIAIYSAPASFSGDTNATPATWSNLPSRPILEKRMRAVVQRVDRGGTPHYVLVAYQNLVSP